MRRQPLCQRREWERLQRREEKVSRKNREKNIWQQPQSTASLQNITILLVRTCNHPSFRHRCIHVLVHVDCRRNSERKSRYITLNHNIMVIFFEFNLNILYSTVFDYYFHWTLSGCLGRFFLSLSLSVSYGVCWDLWLHERCVPSTNMTKNMKAWPYRNSCYSVNVTPHFDQLLNLRLIMQTGRYFIFCTSTFVLATCSPKIVHPNVWHWIRNCDCIHRFIINCDHIKWWWPVSVSNGISNSILVPLATSNSSHSESNELKIDLLKIETPFSPLFDM